MKLQRILTFISIFAGFALASFADSNFNADVFISRKLEVTGLGGSPWEQNISFEEERSRAWMHALHNAYNRLISLPLMEGKLVRHVLATNPLMRERLGVILLLAPRKFYKEDASGLIRCKVSVPVDGKNSLKSALYLEALRPQPQEPLSFLASWTVAAEVDKSAPSVPFKRVVVDVRDYYFEPSLFPRFFDEDGALLFQEINTKTGARLDRPAVIFSNNIAEAYDGYEDSEVILTLAMVNPRSKRDITIQAHDLQWFLRFCRDLTEKPLQQREILVVFDSEKKPPKGRLELRKTEE